MAEHERTKKNIELKTKKRAYTGYDDEEFANGQVGMRRQILAKYDEELEGSQETVIGLMHRSDNTSADRLDLGIPFRSERNKDCS